MKFSLVVLSYILLIHYRVSPVPLFKATINRNVGRIIGGREAAAGQYPFQAAIYKYTEDGRYFCGGSLIRNEWVLTAAQCVTRAIHFEIHLGITRLDEQNVNRLTLSTTDYYFYREHESDKLNHDVALIKFRMPIVYTDFVQSVEYTKTTDHLYPGQVVEAIGWGQTSDGENGLNNNLHVVNVSIVDQLYCRTFYGESLWDSMICAEGNFNEGICFGDIGGPVIVPSVTGGGAVQVAIASWISNNGCESVDPSGYTRIDSYVDWIRATIRGN